MKYGDVNDIKRNDGIMVKKGIGEPKGKLSWREPIHDEKRETYWGGWRKTGVPRYS